MIVKHCKKLKYIRKIVVVTDGKGAMDAEGIEGIVGKIKEENIDLVILWVVLLKPPLWLVLITNSGVDFDDPEFGVKEEDKDPVKVSGAYPKYHANCCAHHF